MTVTEHTVTITGLGSHDTAWQARCSCGTRWHGPMFRSHRSVEDAWRGHVQAETGVLPETGCCEVPA